MVQRTRRSWQQWAHLGTIKSDSRRVSRALQPATARRSGKQAKPDDLTVDERVRGKRHKCHYCNKDYKVDPP